VLRRRRGAGHPQGPGPHLLRPARHQEGGGEGFRFWGWEWRVAVGRAFWVAAPARCSGSRACGRLWTPSPPSTPCLRPPSPDHPPPKVRGVTDAGLTPRPVRRAAVLGGGLMGSGIATALALAGVEVTLKEVNQQFLDVSPGVFGGGFVGFLAVSGGFFWGVGWGSLGGFVYVCVWGGGMPPARPLTPPPGCPPSRFPPRAPGRPRPHQGQPRVSRQEGPHDAGGSAGARGGLPSAAPPPAAPGSAARLARAGGARGPASQPPRAAPFPALLQAAMDGVLARVKGALDYSGFGDQDMVIEAVIEVGGRGWGENPFGGPAGPGS
jgi:hypothetical protein